MSNSKAPLGCVDEFDQAQAGGEVDDGPEVTGGFLAAQCDAFEILIEIDFLIYQSLVHLTSNAMRMSNSRC